MKASLRLTFTVLFCLIGTVFFSSFLKKDKSKIRFPYKQASLTERQAAAHLLSRFTYGAKPGQIDAVVATGLERWFLQQLKADYPDAELNSMLKQYDALKLSNQQVVSTFPKGGQAIKMAIRDGVIHKDSVAKADDRQVYRRKIQAYMEQKGLKPQQELYRQFVSQKILRATYSENQLQEVLTDFWFNHFNVSLEKGQCAEFVPAYERDVIRPNVYGKFNHLLLATAKSPAMLRYLDNFSSVGGTEEMDRAAMLKQYLSSRKAAGADPRREKALEKLANANRSRGLNENYAREVMELHTLGVDGGYTQQDVTQAARILTGWTVAPMNDGYSDYMQKMIDRVGEDKLKQQGFVLDGDFLFAPNRHDRGEKVVLGRRFPANGGYEEGVELLNMLASHPSTAKFISRKLAVRFVSDNPPQSLIDKMAKTFIEKKGDLREVLITMATAPEFWNADALREKTKSPFELAISAVRSLDAKIDQPYQLYSWINKMGQKVYYYQAPTGFPDRASYWINTGSLLNRMNFGLAIASQRIPGVEVNLAALNHNREPESAEAALQTYAKIIMPERELNETIKRLSPMLKDPHLGKKVDEAASKSPGSQSAGMMNEDAVIHDEDMALSKDRNKAGKKNFGTYGGGQMSNGSNTMLAQVVGVIIGSPEFQRK